MPTLSFRHKRVTRRLHIDTLQKRPDRRNPETGWIEVQPLDVTLSGRSLAAFASTIQNNEPMEMSISHDGWRMKFKGYLVSHGAWGEFAPFRAVIQPVGRPTFRR